MIGRDFTATEPGVRLVGDITYLQSEQGWLYLATVLDLAIRMVVGWQMATHMRTSLIVDALQMAPECGHVRPDAIFHSDRGTQYSRPSSRCSGRESRPHQCRESRCLRDNAAAESFFASLKNQTY